MRGAKVAGMRGQSAAMAWVVAALCVLVAVGTARAQVELDWALMNNRTVLMEPVKALVKISNYTGETLDLSPRGNARLRFAVEDQPTSMVPSTGRPLVAVPVIIPPNETREVDVNLLSAYRIVRGQTYALTPMLETGGMSFVGKRLSLEVQPGLELLKRNYGMKANGNAREVSLRLIHRDRFDHMFFRIDDNGSGHCLGVYDLGCIIRYMTPRLEQDAGRVFHVLHQTGPDRFVHSRFSYDGVPLGMDFYVAASGAIQLERTDGGGVVVTGGTKYELDPANPGKLVAPALPPANPHSGTFGTAPAQGQRGQLAPRGAMAPVEP